MRLTLAMIFAFSAMVYSCDARDDARAALSAISKEHPTHD